ncbi:beta-lactamase-like protein [Suillus clintonianus]|uniref:beta-lactamase-like protein n=1 Tax=Suillus clintonianus TaxID=1904413 RepID=UPI001B87498F|nr:beta-lactamase-like protein [Suillus clintonianus]KAG2136397.1 beta-lactamase-like protein [Suillus clintonianus]
MSADTLSLPPPSDEQAYMDVSALEAGHLSVPLDLILAGDQPDEPMNCPSLAFFLRHSKSNKRVVFDLGIHRDIKEFAPAATERFLPVVKQTVAESLEAGGVPPSSVDIVVLSHLHWDHVGDPSPFTTAVFVLGEGSKQVLIDPSSCLNPVAFTSIRLPEDRLRFITDFDLNVAIGPYPRAMDIFGDGSMYIIDASGHVDGHINILARTSPDGAWILLGADSAHHPDLITGKMQIAYRVDVKTCAVMCVHEDKEAAEENIRRMRLLLEVPRVQVLTAHDIYWYEENKNKEVFLPHILLPLV